MLILLCLYSCRTADTKGFLPWETRCEAGARTIAKQRVSVGGPEHVPQLQHGLSTSFRSPIRPRMQRDPADQKARVILS